MKEKELNTYIPYNIMPVHVQSMMKQKYTNPSRPPPVLTRNSLRDSIGRMLRPNRIDTHTSTDYNLDS